jgi:hypothetical protein
MGPIKFVLAAPENTEKTLKISLVLRWNNWTLKI